MSSASPTQEQGGPPTKKIFHRKDGTDVVACFTSNYEHLLREKVQKLRDLLKWQEISSDGPLKPIDVFESPRTNFRMRANFQMWHDDPRNRTPGGFYYSMYDDVDKTTPCEVKQFPRGTPLINRLMLDFMTVFQESSDIFQNLFEVRFLTTQTEEAVVVLCYKRPLSAGWQAAAEAVCKKLNIKIVGRARKMKQVAGGGEETVIEAYNIKGVTYRFYQTEGAFTQPNAAVCEKMITWASDLTEGSSSREEDLLELYCGGGTFTAPMAANFRNVLATEISKASVELAHKSFALNQIGNIKIARLSSEEFSDAYTGKRNFTRLQDNGIDIKSYNISTVLVDPPRAGLDPDTCQLLSRFEKIVYISCNPVTLARDVEKLLETHSIQRVAAFDQFPYTHHLESGVFLVKKNSSQQEKEQPVVVANDGDITVDADSSSSTRSTTAHSGDGPPEKKQKT